MIDDHNELCDIVNTRLKRRSDRTDNDTNMTTQDDPYPWLEPDDPRRSLTDQQIIERYVNLADADLTAKEKRTLIKVIMKHKKAFSLRDEIGTCPNMEVELELKDTKPFFIRPFPIKEGEKDLIDKEMRKGCLLCHRLLLPVGFATRRCLVNESQIHKSLSYHSLLPMSHMKYITVHKIL